MSEINAEFLAAGQSSVDSSAGLLTDHRFTYGRPYGGTGILYRKLYMPNDYGDYGCYENYVELCCKITAIYNSSEAVRLVIAGDFNCSVGSRFY